MRFNRITGTYTETRAEGLTVSVSFKLATPLSRFAPCSHLVLLLDTAADQSGREEALAFIAEERYRADLGKSCLHEPHELERGRRAMTVMVSPSPMFVGLSVRLRFDV